MDFGRRSHAQPWRSAGRRAEAAARLTAVVRAPAWVLSGSAWRPAPRWAPHAAYAHHPPCSNNAHVLSHRQALNRHRKRLSATRSLAMPQHTKLACVGRRTQSGPFHRVHSENGCMEADASASHSNRGQTRTWYRSHRGALACRRSSLATTASAASPWPSAVSAYNHKGTCRFAN